MTEPTITTWAVTTDRDGAPLILATEPNAEECRAALAPVRLNPEARRYSVEPVGLTDHGFAARLAREAVASAFQGGADWVRVRPGDLVPAPAAPAPERIDRDAIRPGDPRWTAEAETLLGLGGFGRDAEPDRAATREKLIAAALAEGWSIHRLGHAILTERAAASEALGPITTAHVIGDDALAAGYGLGNPPADRLWQKVMRSPKPGEVTNATRGTF